MFDFVSLLKSKPKMMGNKLCKTAQRSGEGYTKEDFFMSYMSMTIYNI